MMGLAKIILEASIFSILIASTSVKTIDPNTIFSSSIVNIPIETTESAELPSNINMSGIFNSEIIADSKPLKIQYIPVGNGESILITANGYTMLLDGGENAYEKEFLSYLRNAHINKIDYLIITSARDENLGLLDNLVKNMDIDKIYSPKFSSNYLNSTDYNSLLTEMSKKNKSFTIAEQGNNFKFGDGDITFLYVNNNEPEELDSASVVLQLNYKEMKFLFASNINKEVERKIAWPRADVLKVATKGKGTVSEYTALAKIRPKYAIIIEDDIGHDPKVVENIEKFNTKILYANRNNIIEINYDGEEFKEEKVQNTINR